VVSAAGANHHFDAAGIQEAIREAGFVPAQRDQNYEIVEKKPEF
jgi:cyclic dehypoxanthinyl futalosine synthase